MTSADSGPGPEEPVPPVYGTADSVPVGASGGARSVHDRGSVPPRRPVRGSGTPHNGLAIASLVSAIVAIAVSWIPLVDVVSIVLGAAAVVFAFVAFRRPGQRKLAVAGMIVGIMACVIAVLVLVTFGWFIAEVTDR